MTTSFREWISEHREQIASEPLRGLLHAVFTLYLGLWYTVTSRWPVGTNVYDTQWDLLIVLDGCRVDALESVADEYDFINGIESRWSIGSHSHEWLTQTFSSEHLDSIAGTAYVSGNGHTHETFVEGTYPPGETVPFCWPDWNTVDDAAFGHLDMVWRFGHRGSLGVPPRTITERTVAVGRDADFDRIIAHYMQPHIPYIAGALEDGRSPTDVETKGWKLLESGDADRGDVWELYLDNLRLVLDEVEVLLDNVAADEVVVTADHGNAFGEFGVFGHPEGMLLPEVKEVPWVTTEAVDRGTFTPSREVDETDVTDIEDHLEALGYV